ncbi:MAG: SDR family oxidoreductase [Gammaproteobacteria bacterium]|jgi:3-hydroxy acid dehydrogenase/malonic semialdehyde reductase
MKACKGTVVITGASSGFGRAAAKRFASEGYRLVLMARRLERLTDLASMLEKDAPCHVVELDVRDSKAVSEAFVTLPEPFHQPDILINNAGLALGLSGADAVDLDDWETMVDTNIKGLMYCTRACLPIMVEQGRGHVINMGSVAANWPYPGGNVYGGTKAFVQQFTRNLRTDLLGKGVRATVIEPGMCETEFSVVRFSGDERKAAAVYEGMKPLSADDIADVIVWVALRPAHVNINQIELMPVEQTWSPFAVHRES